MRRYLFAVVLTAGIGASSTTVRAALTSFFPPSGLWRKPEPSQEWLAVAVDYDLQHVTIMKGIYEFPPVTCSDRTGRMECKSWYSSLMIVEGGSDSATTFGLTWLLINNTDIAWTSVEFSWGFGYAWPNTPVEDMVVVENSKFETVSYGVYASALLSGPPGVMPGETMMVEFDVQVGPGHFDDVLGVQIVPEPTAIVFLSLGGLILLRRRRTHSGCV